LTFWERKWLNRPSILVPVATPIINPPVLDFKVFFLNFQWFLMIKGLYRVVEVGLESEGVVVHINRVQIR